MASASARRPLHYRLNDCFVRNAALAVVLQKNRGHPICPFWLYQAV